MHDIERLINVDNPAWPHLQQAFADFDAWEESPVDGLRLIEI